MAALAGADKPPKVRFDPCARTMRTKARLPVADALGDGVAATIVTTYDRDVVPTPWRAAGRMPLLN